MDLNSSSISKSLAISLAQEWKVLQSFLFLYSKTSIVLTLNLFNSLNNSFNLVFDYGLVLISCNSASKRSKFSILKRCIQLSKEFACIILTYFSTSVSVVSKIKSDLATFLIFFLQSLEYNFSFFRIQLFTKCMYTPKIYSNQSRNCLLTGEKK